MGKSPKVQEDRWNDRQISTSALKIRIVGHGDWRGPRRAEAKRLGRRAMATHEKRTFQIEAIGNAKALRWERD